MSDRRLPRAVRRRIERRNETDLGKQFCFLGGSAGAPPAVNPELAQAGTQLGQNAADSLQTFKTQIMPGETAAANQAITAGDAAGAKTAADARRIQLAQSVLAQSTQQRTTDAVNAQNQIGGLQAQTAQGFNAAASGGIPVAQEMNQQALNFNSDAYQQSQAAAAMGDQNTMFANSQRAQQMQQQAAGINPTSGAFAGQANAAQTMEAANTAAAGTRARQAAQQMGWNLNSSALSADVGLAGAGTGAAQSASNAYSAGQNANVLGNQTASGINQAALGASSVGFNTTLATGQNAANMYGSMGNTVSQAYGGANSALGAEAGAGAQAGNLAMQGYQSQVQQGEANAQGTGAMVGTVAAVAIAL